MRELISEAIEPAAGTFDAAAMARGEPGLPTAFTWRDRSYAVRESLAWRKRSEREGGRPGGRLYLRRHEYVLRMDDGSLWTVYCMRQGPRSGSAKRRWYLYAIERDPSGGASPAGEAPT